MIWQAFSDFRQIPVCTLDDLPTDGIAAVLTEDRRDEARLTNISAIMKDRLAVKEVWKELLPEASLLISSAICGGDLRVRFEEAAAKHPCWLLLEPIRMRFPLPCRDGRGTPIKELPSEPLFYSDTLCCQYSHTPEAMFLWDTDETLQTKIRLALESGFLGIAANNQSTVIL